MALRVEHLKYSIGDRAILSEIGISFEPGRFYGIVGPNGSGKTTLLRLLLGLLLPQSGGLLLDEESIGRMKEKARARKLAFVPQMFHVEYAFSVRELVAMGRYPHMESLQKPSSVDSAAVEAALEQTDLLGLAERDVDSLSGGELQRVVIARALAQDTPFILLDEPLSHLDLYNQLEILRLLSHICKEQGKTVICVIHDLNLALRFCEQMVLLREGHVFAQGEPDAVLSEENIQDVFRVAAKRCMVDGAPILIF